MHAFCVFFMYFSFSFEITYCYSDRVYDILYPFLIVGVVSVPVAMAIALTDISLTHMFVNIYLRILNVTYKWVK